MTENFMIRLIWVISLLAMFTGALEGQDITGSWQGSVIVGGQELRVVFQISMDGDKLKAVLYSIDRGAQGVHASSITRRGSSVRISVAAANYEGKLAADGKSIIGTWNQGMPRSLNLTRATPQTAWVKRT